MKVTLITALLAILISCSIWYRHQANGEAVAILAIKKILDVEAMCYRTTGRYCKVSDLGEDCSRYIRSANMADYDIAVQVTDTGFVVLGSPGNRAEPRGRRTFFADEKGVLRHAWLPAIAGPSSDIVR